MFFRMLLIAGCMTVLALPGVNRALADPQVVPSSPQQIQLSFAPIVRKTSPAVVNIYAKRTVRDQYTNPFLSDPLFGQFGFNMWGTPRERVENSLGSGVVVDPAGLVATNIHVIKGAQEIRVVTADGREFDARVKLADDKTDLAILAITDTHAGLPALPLGESDALAVGDLVLAIGNPFGVGQTVTSGIISALARTGLGKSDYGYYIQTDAAINPGNSGGALVDMQGRLVGINSMIFSRDGGSLGIGFAIPVSMLKTVLRTAQSGGKRVVRAWIGFQGQSVTSDMISLLGLKRAQGTLITSVNPKGPAWRAGLRKGDVILAINGYDVSDPEALKFRLGTVDMGSKVKLAVWRTGKAEVLEMDAEAPPEDPPADRITVAGHNPLSGAVIANISPAITEELGGYTAQESGVIVMDAPLGYASRLGFQAGDVILSVNGERVKAVKQLLGALQTVQNRRWVIQLQRGERVMNLDVTI